MLKAKAYAKINLYLEVKNKRPDGYHNIETVMQKIGLFDELEFSQAKDININSSLDIKKQDNLVYKAARKLQEKTGTSQGANIKITKNIPMLAGLGGGSSDAAATLIALNKLWGLNLPMEDLGKIAADLGADVAFFLDGPLAIATGIGEKIKPLKKTISMPLIIAKPSFGVSAKEAYELIYQAEKQSNQAIEQLLGPIKEKNLHKISKNLFNRLEDGVFIKYPEIVKIKNMLLELGAMGALMSGSGSTVFGIASSQKEAEIIAQQIKEEGVYAIATETISK